ncbi:hypothetical protein [uncultured Cellulomonas sp.]|uniref:hypothetical protein n=1 Tax=uncultured Cellulomonas sp. TaxID=189682 RepID=UPI0028EDF9BF|nr:hypothetical protein [uncultured Cellulomonas sp.]
MPPADRSARPRLVRVLAVLAALATVPLWSPPLHVTTEQGVVMVAAAPPPGVAEIRTASVVLVVVLVVATLLVGWRACVHRARRLASLFAVPAAALLWVGWRTEGGGGYTVAMSTVTGQDPPHAFASPWMPVAVAQVMVVLVLAALTTLGLTAARRARADP